MRNKLYYENRIAKLKAKGEVQNRALIAKARRKLQQLEKFNKFIESVSVINGSKFFVDRIFIDRNNGLLN